MKKVLLLAVLGLSGVASAQDAAKSGGGDVRYKKTTTIDFEDDTIEGDLTKPDGEYIEARKEVKHSNLIRIREEFKDQVLDSVGEL
ncbi:MAG TPA: adventurous gliding motility protein CglF [Myxococcaceae bacterium]|nr:adventurous gliding motility protein CglF [Myxococcaceae bacterium]